MTNEDLNIPIEILLVDDKNQNLIALEALLENPNRKFHWATSGEEALGLAYRHDFALILLDVQMPNMDGFEVAKILKSSNSTKHIPIIFVTAYRFNESDVLHGYTEGAVDYLFKPLNPHITRSKVNGFLEMYTQRKYIQQVNKQLDDKVKELKSINVALEEMTNLVSHDLKAPLRTISNFMTLLHNRNKDILDSESLQYMSFCTESANKLDVLIDSLRSYAIVGNQNLDKQIVNLQDIVDTVKNMLLAKIQEQKAKIITEGILPRIFVNQVQYTQLIQNLIDNALKYQSKETEPIIEISSEKTNDLWTISVSDNGIGVTEKFKEKIFNLFQKFHNPREYEGTGVGLAICKRIVESNGGTIGLKSSEGQGTTFYFTVPVMEE